jgi:hypothetical protein
MGVAGKTGEVKTLTAISATEPPRRDPYKFVSDAAIRIGEAAPSNA